MQQSSDQIKQQEEQDLPQFEKISKRKESLEINRILVGVSGGSASGKTTICQNIKKEMSFNGDIDVLIISLDCFYKPLGHEVDSANYDFDSPNALDFELAYLVLQDLLEGKPTKIPRYNFVTHSREEEQDLVQPTDIILFEGILALYDEKIRNLMAYQIFMHTDDDIRLCRRLLRDVNERGRSVEGILYQYNRFVKNSYDIYIKPTMNYADIIVPGRDKNHVSVQFIVDYLKTKAIQMGIFRKVVQRDIVYIGDLVDGNIFQSKEDQESYQKVFIIPSHEDDKKHIKSSFFLLKEGIFTRNICNVAFKEFSKMGLKLWKKLCRVEKYDIQDVEVMNITQLLKQKDNEEIYSNRKKFILITVPILINKQQELDTIFSNFGKFSPNSQIIFISLFADLKTLKKYNEQYNNIKKLINIFLIGNKMKFYEMVKENSQDVQMAEKFYNLDFLGQKIFQSQTKQILKWKNAQGAQEGSETSDDSF